MVCLKIFHFAPSIQAEVCFSQGSLFAFIQLLHLRSTCLLRRVASAIKRALSLLLSSRLAVYLLKLQSCNHPEKSAAGGGQVEVWGAARLDGRSLP